MPKIKSFRAEYGHSVEIHGEWKKFHCAIEIEPEEGDNMEEIKEKAWNTVYVEIEKQIRDLD